MPDVEGDGGNVRNDMRGVLPAGTALRGYELKSILGQGAFGITYRACDITLHRDVAIKEYLPTSLALREGRTTVVPRSADHAEQFAWGRERFLDEARTLARLDRTPAIVRVHDYLEANGTAYMVMALIEGETLSKRLTREQRLAPETIERLVFPLLDGLEEVHAAGFLHRDIKPANIMLDTSGRPTLIDFGAARAAMAGRSTTLTAIFTPGYAAAEQFTSANLGPWSDIYGLAATLYHAITGQIPPSAVERIMNDSYQPLGELQLPGYPAALLAGIDGGLAVRAEDRPRSIAEWRHMLRSEEWLSSHEKTRVARKPGRLARAARRSRQTRVTIRGPALWSAAAAAILVLAGGGYLAYQANAPGTVGTAALSLSAEQLEQALVERRKADTLAAEKRRLEDEARQKAEVEAAAKRQAEVELEQAHQARQKAEDELARLKADIEARRRADPDQRGQADAAKQRVAEEEARRKAEAGAASLRHAEEEAGKKVAADAEAKQQADEALARAEAERQRAEADARAKAEAETVARRQASEEAQRKAEAEAASQRQADEAQAKAQAERDKADAEAKARSEAETAERGLRLETADRQRLQVALTSLDFDTRGSDGLFGPRSREMIAAWQKKVGAPATGFLTAAQRDQLLRSSAPAVARWDEEQKKIKDEKTGADPAKVAAAASSAAGLSAPASPSPPVTGQPASTAFDGTYVGNVNTVGYSGSASRAFVSLKVINGRGSGTIDSPGCSSSRFTVAISPAGQAGGEGYLNCTLGGSTTITGALKVDGKFEDKSLRLSFRSERGSFEMLLTPDSGASRTSPTPDSPPPASPPPPAPATPAPATASPPGAFDGTYAVTRPSGGGQSSLTLAVSNGRGSLQISQAGCNSAPIAIAMTPDGEISGQGDLTCPLHTWAMGPATIRGRISGGKATLSLSTSRGEFPVTLDRSGGGASPTVASPDGLWRGTYKCSASLNVSSVYSSQEFTLALVVRLAGGSGIWRSSGPEASNGFTLETRVSVDGNAVTVARFILSSSAGMSTPATLSGRYDGNTIGGTGRELKTSRECSLALTRA